ncbi:hypothetical protein [Arthrospira platensis]|jgi:hypothetical protein|uniref:Secreted protein n=1 Tax=Limnospira platensis NIES-46 TaxID=1236695 RepID=A0A5M3T094_LIMPL|nr:hypothetical protein [Arthrospira platensis]AMW30333.1 hypothetical protein AP285_22780 [Arthrospira platensis YZ]KDR55918.1 hypothetical protein APPUASWS_019555 [Arthrospira platensis str. Paraca]MDT9181386.1 hypothetical protein [Limnospira sp. PMC 289.06]MDT9293447.1 hypothetical protein [Arthrospira platensis PCC 7345]MDT9310983.1 hypothetical protein [Limnospira sp. Paracas R14]BDT15245.1 hypothetical protein N39L_49680 [Arthrospira platensis NIES-39]
MKLKILLITLLVVFCAWVIPAQAAEPLKTYSLNILSEMSRQSIKLDPPVTQMTVRILKPGDVAIPCGDGQHTYTCTSGKLLWIQSDQDQPIRQFWGQNTAEKPVYLTLEVFQQLQPEEVEDDSSDLTMCDHCIKRVAATES